MSNTVRIRTTPNGSDKYLKVKLDQDFDFVEILSLKISQEDAYRKFCSDYGVIVGRVTINNGFGVENAKVSVFIPLDDIDKNNPLIKGLYPYEVLTDKDSDGIRYNLLPKVSETDNECYTPVGTFPSKREVLDNDTMLEVYCKYYKFTTTTNYAGDFMIFGVPLGAYQVHVDADISDIGIASQRPYDSISQGTPAKMFESPTKYKGGKNLNKLIQVKTLNSGVNVQPFWGDQENCVVGITRLDFDLNTTIVPAAIFMGSIYGDQDKHSINKHCRPRRKLGLTCEQVTGPGSVDMIRKTLDNKIEEFSVDGGRVIDDDGTWAFQVPMNLDYMVTAEDGSLILSQDPNSGIPTRARVRFNIGMDETGGEGRLRTRARYLVPNNPQATGISDYTFGEDTDDKSFKDLYWNKIYTVSNYISRFQRNLVEVLPKRNISTRGFVGMKDVDACAGDKTPYPFNKVATELNPIFFIICLIIKIIGFIVYLINKILNLINAIIDIINNIVGAIVNFIANIVSVINSIPGVSIGGGPSWTNIAYIPCITLKCPDDPATYYAPGCSAGSSGLGACSPAANYYPGDGSHPDNFGELCGFDKCMAFEMAKSLNLFQFDFYNDWINGTLFGFLLKYKKKKNKREVFCEYECEGSGTFTAIDGTDGNTNGNGDNSCQDNLLLDTCYPAGSSDDQKEGKDSGTIREGLIKKVGDEFFYAAATHDLSWNLFATDIMCLGSVFECDWQGIPHIQKLLIPTTYKVPPDEEELNASNQVEVTGMVNLGGSGQCGNFFNIDCLGLHVDDKMALNIRHICEMGVEIDQAVEDLNGNIITNGDCVLGPDDIDDASGKWFRDVFTTLNSAYTSANSFAMSPIGLDTDFNSIGFPSPATASLGYYDFASPSQNGKDYIDFRGFPNSGSYAQSKHSYFFYFGLLPGKTALDKMNQRFFTTCVPAVNTDILINSQTTVAPVGGTGSMTFTFIGGTGPFTYIINGVTTAGGSVGPITGTATGNPPTATITGLSAGTYTISALDSNGTPVSATIVVPGQPSLYATVAKTKDTTTTVSNDGQITISSVGGGLPPYTYKLYSNANVLLSSGSLTAPKLLNGLAHDTLIGYKVEVIDSSLTTLTFTGITIGGPNPISITATGVNITCYGSSNGSIATNVTGGFGVVTTLTTGPGFTNTTTGSPNLSGLIAGTYVVTSTDISGGSATTSVTLSQPPKLYILPYVLSEVEKQCDPLTYVVPFYIADTGVSAGALAAGTFNYEFSVDGGAWIPVTGTYSNSTTPIYLSFLKSLFTVSTNLRIRFSLVQSGNLCTSNILTIPASAIVLPTVALGLTNLTAAYQCTPTTASVVLNITRDPARAPITIEYSKDGGSTWLPAGAPTSVSLGFTYTITGLVIGGGISTTYNLLFRGTDIKGCVSNNNTPIPVMVTLPNAVLNVSINTGAQITTIGPNYLKYPHTVNASGGFGGYSPSVPFTVYDTSVSYSSPTITDAQGCVATQSCSIIGTCA
jgi:hypothetical protein